MAERRMFSKTIIGSDSFLDMPLSAQAFYLHLSVQADDDGFVNNPKTIQRMIGASDEDFKILVDRRFLLTFETGVACIRHWKCHNYIPKDRYRKTVYRDEKDRLMLDETNLYRFAEDGEEQEKKTDKENPCIQSVYKMDTQDSIGKDSINKDSIGEKGGMGGKEVSHKYGEFRNVLLSESELQKLKEEFPVDWLYRIENLSSHTASTGKRYKNHLATIRSRARNDSKGQQKKQSHNYDLDREAKEALERFSGKRGTDVCNEQKEGG